MSIVLDHGHTWERPPETDMFQALSDVLRGLRPFWNPRANTYRTDIHVPLLFDHVCVAFVEGAEVDKSVTAKLLAHHDPEQVTLYFTDFTRPGDTEPIRVRAPLIRRYTDMPPAPTQLLDGIVLSVAPNETPSLHGLVAQEQTDIIGIDQHDAVAFARACHAHLPYHK